MTERTTSSPFGFIYRKVDEKYNSRFKTAKTTYGQTTVLSKDKAETRQVTKQDGFDDYMSQKADKVHRVAKESLPKPYVVNCRTYEKRDDDTPGETLKCRHITRGTLMKCALAQKVRELPEVKVPPASKERRVVKRSSAALLRPSNVEQLSSQQQKHIPDYAKVFLRTDLTDSPDLNKCVEELCAFHVDRFGESLEELAQNMQTGDIRFCELLSENHSMFLSISKKEDGSYRITFRDPNTTNQSVHIHIKSGNLSEVSLKMLFIYNHKYYDHYFSKFKCGLLRVFNEKQMSTLLTEGRLHESYTPPKAINWEKVIAQLEDPEKETENRQALSSLLFFALSHNASPEIFKKIFFAIKDKTDLFNLLKAESPDDFPGLYKALYYGHQEAVKAFMEGLVHLYKEGLLSKTDKTELFNLLKAEVMPEGTLGLTTALHNGHQEAVKTFMEGLIHLYREGVFSETDKTELLNLLIAKNHKGISNLSMILYNGHYDKIEAFLQILPLKDQQELQVILEKEKLSLQIMDYISSDYGQRKNLGGLRGRNRASKLSQAIRSSSDPKKVLKEHLQQGHRKKISKEPDSLDRYLVDHYLGLLPPNLRPSNVFSLSTEDFKNLRARIIDAL